MPLYIIYESAINIYFFYMAFTARFEHQSTFILRAYAVRIICLHQFLWLKIIIIIRSIIIHSISIGSSDSVILL